MLFPLSYARSHSMRPSGSEAAQDAQRGFEPLCLAAAAGVDLAGLDPAISALQVRRAPFCTTGPG